jgi:hypothetical protein
MHTLADVGCLNSEQPYRQLAYSHRASFEGQQPWCWNDVREQKAVQNEERMKRENTDEEVR